ncbi:hypothetical protein F66182_7499 [Fusarium sp. NRRL 66182]|nr:hypothetical protein F66182_7499 [Fusarium sp. NRRL 66182]
MSQREKRPCELPKPETTWFWTRYWKKFLIIPRIPISIRRDLMVEITAVEAVDSDGESVSTLKEDTEPLDLVRLSLHLGSLPLLLPSFMDTPHPNTQSVPPQDARSSDGDIDNEDAPGGRRLVVSQQPAGGEVEDWRPMSEYADDEYQVLPNSIAPPASCKDSDLAHDAAETAREQMLEERYLDPEASESYQNRALLDESAQGSPKSERSIATAILTRNEKEEGKSTGTHLGTLSPHLSRVCAENLSVLDFATPRAKSKMIDHSPYSLAAIDKRSPLARFPISAQPTHRLTPGTLTKRVVGDSGGQIHAEDARQARFVSSPSSGLPQGLSADLWDAEVGSIISDLQPEPLHINRQKPKANIDNDRRWSRMFDGLSSDVSSTLGRFAISTSLERDGGSNRMFNEEDCATAETDQTICRLKDQLRNPANMSPAPASLQRSASTIITPTQSLRRIQHKASFNLEKRDHSGFTPEHCREEISKGTFPRSGMMLNLQDTQTRLRYPLKETAEPQFSRSLDGDATPRARRFPDVPVRYQQRPVLND